MVGFEPKENSMTRLPGAAAVFAMALFGATGAQAEAARHDPLTLAAFRAKPEQAIRSEAPKGWTPDVARSAYPQTAVERRVGEKATAAAGFLCGIAPGHNETGGPSAYGYDPHGRFVGAQFKLAFR
jgi:hypothetical protein